MKGFHDREIVGRWGIVVLYLLLCVLYFLPPNMPYKVAYPLLLLTLVSLWGHTPMLSLALGFSALGDVCGAEGALLFQIGAFAVAQICYFVLLFGRLPKQPFRRIALASIMPIVLCAIALAVIIPAIELVVMRVAVVAYALLIGAMVTVATLSNSWRVRIGAYLFVLSDFMLAYLIFLSPNGVLMNVSLALYFAGQLLLWLGLQSRA